MRWTWIGWNQPPDRFSRVHTSTASRAGSAMTSVKFEAATSAQVWPLMVHSPFLRSKRRFRVLAPAGSRWVTSGSPRGEGIRPLCAGSKESATTSNPITSSVFGEVDGVVHPEIAQLDARSRRVLGEVDDHLVALG